MIILFSVTSNTDALNKTHKQYEISIWEDKYSVITPDALFVFKTNNMLLIFYHVSLKRKPEFLGSRTRRRSIR